MFKILCRTIQLRDRLRNLKCGSIKDEIKVYWPWVSKLDVWQVVTLSEHLCMNSLGYSAWRVSSCCTLLCVFIFSPKDIRKRGTIGIDTHPGTVLYQENTFYYTYSSVCTKSYTVSWFPTKQTVMLANKVANASGEDANTLVLSNDFWPWIILFYLGTHSVQ